MSFQQFMNKVRHWDNMTARWLMRHFYFMFFQMVLLIIFIFWFANLFQVVDANLTVGNQTLEEKLLKIQATNTSIIVILLLLNSFWMLYIFNGIQRQRTILKDISFGINKLRMRNK